MRPFGWKKWHSLLLNFKKSGWTSLERWGLSYLHSKSALDELAHSVAHSLRLIGKPSGVSVQSIWVDGTPQIAGYSATGFPLKSELADLLFILNETDQKGVSVRRTGLLLQGKVGKRHNKLPSNPSTKKERQLLENLDRNRPLEVYRDMSATKSSQIGTYTLGGSTHGLKDCSRYLMMPKTASWYPFCPTIAPLIIGWPPSKSSSELRSLVGFVEAIQRAVILGTIGRQIQDNVPSLKCEWSRLVWDLLGDYQPKTMIGYGSQARVNDSSNVLAFMTFLSEEQISGQLRLPPMKVTAAKLDFDRLPAISVGS